MTALSAGILIFLVLMLSIAASIHYLRDRKNRLNAGRANEKNRPVGNRNLNETTGVKLDADSGSGGNQEISRPTLAIDARIHAKPTAVKTINRPSSAAPAALKSVYTKPAYTKKYPAVSVRPQLNCCRAVLVFEHIRFLAEEAPHFPVPGCSAEHCRCQYIYHADRRDEDRRSDFGIARGWTPVAGGERRHTDRRRAGV
jgi:hypothetical protein